MTRSTATRLAVPVNDSDHSRGPDTAPVTLVEYGDFECSSCGEAFPILRELLGRLGPRLRLVFRSFPLSTVHPHAEHAAQAAEIAAAHGQFWPMHDAMFENQAALEDEDLAEYAGGLGMDKSQFLEQLAGQVYADRVRKEFMGGVHCGVNGTPTFFINEVRYDGPWDSDALLNAIEYEAAHRDQPGVYR